MPPLPYFGISCDTAVEIMDKEVSSWLIELALFGNDTSVKLAIFDYGLDKYPEAINQTYAYARENGGHPLPDFEQTVDLEPRRLVFGVGVAFGWKLFEPESVVKKAN